MKNHSFGISRGAWCGCRYAQKFQGEAFINQNRQLSPDVKITSMKESGMAKFADNLTIGNHRKFPAKQTNCAELGTQARAEYRR
jgi:hypothetical protein